MALGVAVVTTCGLCADRILPFEFSPLPDSSGSRRLCSHRLQRHGITGPSSSRRKWRHGCVSIRGALVDSTAERVQGTTVQPDPTSRMGLLDTSLQSTNEHRVWVGAGAAAVVGLVTKAVISSHSSADSAGICLGAIVAYVLADLGTGIYHWGIDNYGDAKTPLFGSQIDAFQGHHQRPWTITRREFSNNIHAIVKAAIWPLIPFFALPGNPALDSFAGVFVGLIIMSQQFHAWAHTKKSQLPPVVQVLQKNGILVSVQMHGRHHRPPYDINYCIVSGLWNSLLDSSSFFPRLEAAIFSTWGIAPRCWGETPEKWLQEGSYYEDVSDDQAERT